MTGQPSAKDGGGSVSVVVLSYNRRDLLRENLRRLRELSPAPREIIVVDNASCDGSLEMIRAEFPEITLVANDENLGVARGRNAGFRRASGDFIVYLDDDSFAPVDICDRTVALFDRFPRAGCLAYEMYHDDRLWSQWEDGTKVSNYYGGGHAFRTAALKAIDFLDESMWFGGEEIDSSLRLYRAGYDVVAATSIRIVNTGMKQSPETAVKRAADWYTNFFGFYLRFFPYPLALLFIGRMTVSYVGLCFRTRTARPLTEGAARALQRLPDTLRGRDVVPDWLARFYADPSLVPAHYNVSVVSKLRSKLKR